MKKISLLLLSLFVIGATMAQNMADRYQPISKVDKSERCDNVNKVSFDGTKALWDVVWSFDAEFGGQPGVETDGTNIYCPNWNDDTITRYDMDGSNATRFVIDDVSNIRDLAYDGIYFYGAASDMNLKVMDLANEILINTISASCTGITGIRHIAFDPTLDGGNGGFWIGNWSELGAIDMNGNELVANQGNESCYGSAWDNSDPENPVLWLFQLNGPEEVTFHQWDINTMSFTGVTHEASDVPGFESGSTAGGACTWDDPATGKKLLIGNIQQTPNLIFAYDLSGEPANFAYDIDLMELDMPIQLAVSEEAPLAGTIKNLGTETVSSFDISFSIDGGDPTVIAVTGVSIDMGSEYAFTTTETIAFDNDGAYEIEVTIENINGNNDEDPSNNTLTHIINVFDGGTVEMWDVMWTFTGNGSGKPGIETDGLHFYTAAWNGETLTRFDMDGGNATDFTIEGVSNIRDLAYDGTYFYGAAGDLNLKVMDFANETLIATISVTCGGVTGIRHIAFDPTLDSGNGGLWIGNWNELGAIDMDGNELIPNVEGNASCYGSAYDDSDLAHPALWLFQQTGEEKVTFRKFDINTLSFTDITHEATDVPGYIPGDASLAGGACTWDDPESGLKLLIGSIQQQPNLYFAYNISNPESEPIFQDKFDTYSAGEQVACQNPGLWTTWSGSPCGDDDPFVSDEQSFSGANSVFIAPDDDLVLDLPEYLTSGKYSIKSMIYVPAGGNAYYNVMASFQEPREWAFQVFFNVGGDGSVDAGATAAATFDFEFDTWMESKVVVDLNADWAEYFLDGTLIYAWQWTLGASGGGCALQLGALDFYGQPGSDFYFDDMAIYVEDALPAPSNLTADVINNSVELNWTAAGPPSSKELIGYNVYRDNELIAEEISEVTYIDNELLPGTYVYDVKAVFDEGFSAGAGSVEATVEGGVDRNLVIIEVATGTWCGFCPGAAMGVDEMHAEGLSVGIIEYHGSDSYETSESSARIDYYDVPGFPTAQFDGGNTIVGGSATQSMYPTYLPVYEQQIATPALFEIEATCQNIGGDNYQIAVDAEMIENYPWLNNNYILHVVLTESHIPESWQNQTELNFVCRDMIPDQNGTDMDFTGNPVQSVVLDFTIPPTYNMENVEIIVFIQDIDTKQIMQGATTMLITGVTNSNEQNRIDVYPVPATNQVNISATRDIHSIKVYNSFGQIVFIENSICKNYLLNTSDYNTGLFFIRLETETGIVTKRFIIE
ncbi:MAG: hypothetical protein C0591_03360 [Marinilabiliales bacterium]|nr:MAG: hypothetical protein C0591_03360 [Marinilabiliales bacterium]